MQIKSRMMGKKGAGWYSSGNYPHATLNNTIGQPLGTQAFCHPRALGHSIKCEEKLNVTLQLATAWELELNGLDLRRPRPSRAPAGGPTIFSESSILARGHNQHNYSRQSGILADAVHLSESPLHNVNEQRSRRRPIGGLSIEFPPPPPLLFSLTWTPDINPDLPHRIMCERGLEACFRHASTAASRLPENLTVSGDGSFPHATYDSTVLRNVDRIRRNIADLVPARIDSDWDPIFIYFSFIFFSRSASECEFWRDCQSLNLLGACRIPDG